MPTLAETLPALRLARGLTQRQLADQVGVSQATVAKWEREENAPTVDSIEAMVRVLRPDRPDRFRFLAYLAHVPAAGRALMRQA